MKKQYTEMITILRRAHKRLGEGYDSLYVRGLQMIDESDTDEKAFRRVQMAMEHVYETTAEARHIFMPGLEFCVWLAGCATTLDLELSEKAVDGFGARFVCLHFPCETGLPSALAALGVTSERRDCVIFEFSAGSPYGGAYKTHLTGQDAAAEPRILCNAQFEGGAADLDSRVAMGNFYTRMIAGLGLYMSCFPEQVKDGIPADAKRAEYAAGIAKTIGVSEHVLCRDGMTPHYRTGHFRLLSADRYVNKKGQVVFVHGCFVKGQAKTVLAPEQEVG